MRSIQLREELSTVFEGTYGVDNERSECNYSTGVPLAGFEGHLVMPLAVFEGVRSFF